MTCQHALKRTQHLYNYIYASSLHKYIREAAPVIKTGTKWPAKTAKYVVEAKAAFQIGDIVGQVQHGRGGLSLVPPKWHKAGPV